MDTQDRQVAIREPHYERVGMLTLGSGGGVPAVQNMAEVVSIAQLMAKSGIAIRKHLRDQPGACLGVALQALRWEMDPYMVGNKSYSVNDQLAYEAQLLAAVVLTRAAIAEEPDYEYDGEPFKTRKCTVSFKMRSGKVLAYTTPETSKITPKNSPLWKSDEDQQLGYYAVRAWARRHQPHVLLGAYTPEEASEFIDVTPQTSGVMDRLAGKQEGAGFDQAHVEREAKSKKASSKGEDPVNSDTAGPKMDLSKITSSKPPEDVIAEGYPEPGEVYHLNGDEWTYDIMTDKFRRDTYKDGKPFSTALHTAGREVYEDHRPERAAPPAEAAPQEPVEEVAETEDIADELPPEFEAFISAVESAGDWTQVKTALGAFQKTALWPTLSEAEMNKIRANTWDTMSDQNVAWIPDPSKDLSAYRLWIETQTDTVKIEAMMSSLQAQSDWLAKPEQARNVVASATQARLKHLAG